MNTSDPKFWVEFEGGRLIIHGKNQHVATMFLDRLVALQDDKVIEKAVEEKFGGKCTVIPMPVDYEFVDKQLLFTIPLSTPMRKEGWFLKTVQRDLAGLLNKVRQECVHTST